FNIQLNNQGCTASYTIVKDTTAPFQVILYNTSSNAISHTYAWSFGDGSFGTGRTPTHQYQNHGSYLVCLKITDTVLNCVSTFCDTVGMDSLGNLKSGGFSIEVREPLAVGINEFNRLNEVSLYPNPAIN